MPKAKTIHCLVASAAARLIAVVRPTQDRSVAWWIETNELKVTSQLEWESRFRPQYSDISPDGEHAFLAFLQGSHEREAEVWARGESEPQLYWRHSYGTPKAGRFVDNGQVALTVNYDNYSRDWEGPPASLKLDISFGINPIAHRLWPVVDRASFEHTSLEFVIDDSSREDAILQRSGWLQVAKGEWRKTQAVSGHTITRYRRRWDETEEFRWDGPSKFSSTGTTLMDFDSDGNLITCGHGRLRVIRFTDGRWILVAEREFGCQT